MPAETIDGMSVWTVREAAAARGRACPRRGWAGVRRGADVSLRRPLAQRPRRLPPEGELDDWRERDPIVVLRAQLEAEGVDAAGLDELEQDVTGSWSECARRVLRRRFRPS